MLESDKLRAAWQDAEESHARHGHSGKMYECAHCKAQVERRLGGMLKDELAEALNVKFTFDMSRASPCHLCERRSVTSQDAKPVCEEHAHHPNPWKIDRLQEHVIYQTRKYLELDAGQPPHVFCQNEREIRDAVRALDAYRGVLPEAPPATLASDCVMRFVYTNYKGVTSVRSVFPWRMRYAATEHHPKPQWIMDAYDIEKGANRSFAMADMQGCKPAERARRRSAASSEAADGHGMYLVITRTGDVSRPEDGKCPCGGTIVKVTGALSGSERFECRGSCKAKWTWNGVYVPDEAAHAREMERNQKS